MAVEPPPHIEVLDRASARRQGVAREIVEYALDGAGEGFRRRWLDAIPRFEMRDADTGLVADELHRSSARRVDDRKATGHGLDDSARAGVVYCRMQQQMRASVETGSVALRVAAKKRYVLTEPELREERPRRHDVPSRHEEPGIWVYTAHKCEGSKGQLEPVRLQLISSEEQNRPAGWRLLSR